MSRPQQSAPSDDSAPHRSLPPRMHAAIQLSGDGQAARTDLGQAAGDVSPHLSKTNSGEPNSGEPTPRRGTAKHPFHATGGAKPPAAAIRRMSLYLRELQRFDPAVQTVSSRELAARLDVSADVVRHDLAMLGSVGRRGVGYEITTLVSRLRTVLGSDTHWRVVLVGTGSLGHALLRYQGFERLGFELVAALDIDPKRIGEKIGGVTIRDAADMNAIFLEYRPQLAILAVPADVAASVAAKITQGGVTGILNFAPTSLKLPGEIGVINVDLASEMQRLAFHVLQRPGQPETAG